MRQHHVIVSFGKDGEFDFKVPASETGGKAADAARQWFDREFVALEADVATPVGKVLLADRILSVAKYSGARRFRDEAAWAEQFARNTAALLARDVIKVDVENYSVGF
jgi:hypothetical protein